jgi:hypothetical protein
MGSRARSSIGPGRCFGKVSTSPPGRPKIPPPDRTGPVGRQTRGRAGGGARRPAPNGAEPAAVGRIARSARSPTGSKRTAVAAGRRATLKAAHVAPPHVHVPALRPGRCPGCSGERPDPGASRRADSHCLHASQIAWSPSPRASCAIPLSIKITQTCKFLNATTPGSP